MGSAGNLEYGEFVTPAEEARRKAREKKRADNRARFQKAKDQASSPVKVVTARQPVGTKVGNKQRMQEFKDKLLTDHNGNNIIRKVLEVAMDDEHPGQMNALKLCMDRMLPTSMFDEAKTSGDRPTISINITGIGESVSVGNTIEHDPIDGEVLDG